MTYLLKVGPAGTLHNNFLYYFLFENFLKSNKAKE
jgi:hypothetical protein